MSTTVGNPARAGAAGVPIEEHPAAAAWRLLHPLAPPPRHIEILGGERRHSIVYRLHGAGPGGSPIVAKFGATATGETERMIYGDMLPALHLPHPAWLGFLPEESSCWIFLEDAGDLPCPVGSPAAARWLAAFHVQARHFAGTLPLPRRGAAHYLALGRTTRALITGNIDNPSLSAADRRLLLRIVGLVERAGDHGDEAAAICDSVPVTVIHGDFVGKNLRLRADDGAVVPLDWEHAGCGSPAPDLERIDCDAYARALLELGDRVTREEIGRLAAVGRVFRIINFIYWAGLTLRETWTAKVMGDRMPVYHDDLRAAMRDAGWDNGF